MLIARKGKPHDIREELLIPAVKEVIQTVMHKSPQQMICLEHKHLVWQVNAD